MAFQTDIFPTQLFKNETSGEILENPKQHLTFDTKKSIVDELYDYYYAIVPSEFEESEEGIIKIYRVPLENCGISYSVYIEIYKSAKLKANTKKQDFIPRFYSSLSKRAIKS